MDITRTTEYLAVSKFYKGKYAERSGLPYMNHINEGLLILDEIGASGDAKRAFCIHPMCQANEDLANFNPVNAWTLRSMINAIEYRNIANQFLSFHYGQRLPVVSPLNDVNDMLIADKVQNFKDFEDHHEGIHPKSDDLKNYFEQWLFTLGYTRKTYDRLANLLREHNATPSKAYVEESIRSQ
jgi:hypothetical protein